MVRRLALVCIAAWLLAGPALAEMVWDMPTGYPDENFHTKNIRQFADDVERTTGGQLKIAVRSAGALVKHSEIKSFVRDGHAPIGEALISLYAAESPVYTADSIPFLASSFGQARRFYTAHRPMLKQRLAEEGLVLLFSVPWPPQGIFARKELRTIDDFKGLKLRTHNPAARRFAELVGALPVQVEVPELKAAFDQGRVEATITSGASGVQARYWDFVSHFHDVQAWIPRNMVFANRAAFETLPEALRKALTEAAGLADARGWNAAEQETAERARLLVENRMTIVEPQPALREALKAIGRRMAAEWAVGAGIDGKTMLEKYGQTE